MTAVGVIGHVARDLLDGGRIRVGGAPYYAARALRLAGCPARIIAKCGAEHRRELLPGVIGVGLPLTWREARSTASFAISYDGEARTMSVEGVGDPWTVADVTGWASRALAGVDWLHVAPLVRSDFPLDTLAVLARRRRLSLDGQGLVRPSRLGPLRLDGDHDPAVLRPVSILKLSEEEARALVGGIEEAALRALGVREVVVTLGSQGALLVTREAAQTVPARPLAGISDFTGAGDAFAAGYLAARSRRQSPATAARRANELVAAMLTRERR